MSAQAPVPASAVSSGPEAPALPKKHLLVCIDGSPMSFEALKYAVSMCHAHDEIVILTLYDNPTLAARSYSMPPVGPIIGISNIQDLTDEKEHNKKIATSNATAAEKYVMKAAPTLSHRSIISSSLEPRDDILEIATRERKPSVIPN